MNAPASSALLTSIMPGPPARIVSGMLRVLFPDAESVLDVTYGGGKFWDGSAPVAVTGLDLDPARAPHVVGDFRALPFPDDSFDVVAFDPPYHTDMGCGKPSIMGSRFGTFGTIPELREAVEQGCREAWRVARLGVVVKVQDYIHASRLVLMSDWVRAAIPMEPYDFVHGQGAAAVVDPKWREQLSVRHQGQPTYWAFRTDGPVHRRRAWRRGVAMGVAS